MSEWTVNLSFSFFINTTKGDIDKEDYVIGYFMRIVDGILDVCDDVEFEGISVKKR